MIRNRESFSISNIKTSEKLTNKSKDESFLSKNIVTLYDRGGGKDAEQSFIECVAFYFMSAVAQ